MKKVVKFIAIVCSLLVITATLCACAPDAEGGGEIQDVVITVTAAESGKTLDAVMTERGLNFVEANGMITSINGVENGLNSYWMLYTNDPNFSNTAWGTAVYGDQTLGSASLGATELVVSEGYVYLWTYQTF